MKIFHSFEEQQADYDERIRKMSMQERISEAVELIKRIYNYHPSPDPKPRKLTIKKTPF
ncbi:MAG: hypothetical protein ACOYOA_04045 [Saprospiraceae bacterium]